MVTKTRPPEVYIANINVKFQRLQKWSAKVVTQEISGGRITTMVNMNTSISNIEFYMQS